MLTHTTTSSPVAARLRASSHGAADVPPRGRAASGARPLRYRPHSPSRCLRPAHLVDQPRRSLRASRTRYAAHALLRRADVARSSSPPRCSRWASTWRRSVPASIGCALAAPWMPSSAHRHSPSSWCPPRSAPTIPACPRPASATTHPKVSSLIGGRWRTHPDRPPSLGAQCGRAIGGACSCNASLCSGNWTDLLPGALIEVDRGSCALHL